MDCDGETDCPVTKSCNNNDYRILDPVTKILSMTIGPESEIVHLLVL